MYELYTANRWYGNESRFYETLQEVTDVLEREHYSFKWSYEMGREVLHENDRGSIAQVFHDGKDVTRTLCPGLRNLTVLY